MLLQCNRMICNAVPKKFQRGSPRTISQMMFARYATRHGTLR